MAKSKKAAPKKSRNAIAIDRAHEWFKTRRRLYRVMERLCGRGHGYPLLHVFAAIDIKTTRGRLGAFGLEAIFDSLEDRAMKKPVTKMRKQ